MKAFYQTMQLCRLIGVFVGCSCDIIGFVFSVSIVILTFLQHKHCLSVCHFVLVFFSPFSIAITSLGEERANLSAFHTFVRSVLVWICRFPLGVWEGLRFVIVALPGLFSYLFFLQNMYLHKIYR